MYFTSNVHASVESVKTNLFRRSILGLSELAVDQRLIFWVPLSRHHRFRVSAAELIQLLLLQQAMGHAGGCESGKGSIHGRS